MGGMVLGWVVLVALVVVNGLPLYAQQLPKLSDYPAGEIFRGTPAAPRLDTPEKREFRTRLRQEAALGPNFAGRFRLATWGCGTECRSLAVIDVRSGEVWMVPFQWEAASETPLRPACHLGGGYDVTSELLIAQGQVLDKAGTHFLHWQNGRFTLLRFVEGFCRNSDLPRHPAGVTYVVQVRAGPLP